MQYYSFLKYNSFFLFLRKSILYYIMKSLPPETASVFRITNAVIVL